MGGAARPARTRRAAPLVGAARLLGAAPGPPDADAATGPAYEVTYLLAAPDQRVGVLRGRLAAVGDSALVGGGDGLWSVHVHTDDIGAALEVGLEAGRPHRVRVVPLEVRATQPRPGGPADPAQPAVPTPVPVTGTRRVICAAAGPGLAALCVAAGALPVAGGPGGHADAGALYDAISRAEAAEVVLLPNSPASLTAATAAAERARAEGRRVAVVPARATVQALAALAVTSPTRRFDDDVVTMTSAAGHARTGAVTLAARDAVTTGGPCRRGDVLGVVDADFVIVGTDLAAVAGEVAQRMLAAGGELLTLVRGAEAPPALADAVGTAAAAAHPGLEVVVHDGGQERYPLLLGVE